MPQPPPTATLRDSATPPTGSSNVSLAVSFHPRRASTRSRDNTHNPWVAPLPRRIPSFRGGASHGTVPPHGWLDLTAEAHRDHPAVTMPHVDGFRMGDFALPVLTMTHTRAARAPLRDLANDGHRRSVPLCLYYPCADISPPNYASAGRRCELPTPTPATRPISNGTANTSAGRRANCARATAPYTASADMPTCLDIAARPINEPSSTLAPRPAIQSAVKAEADERMSTFSPKPTLSASFSFTPSLTAEATHSQRRPQARGHHSRRPRRPSSSHRRLAADGTSCGVERAPARMDRIAERSDHGRAGSANPAPAPRPPPRHRRRSASDTGTDPKPFSRSTLER